MQNFLCVDCSYNTILREYYMLRNNVWLQANPKDQGMLCIGCVERRLKRKLTPDDFSNYPINWNFECGCNSFVNKRSLRLRRRLGFTR